MLFLTLHFLSRRGPILALDSLNPKWISFDLPSGPWLPVHMSSHSLPSPRSPLHAPLSTLPTLNSSVSLPSSQIKASSHDQTISTLPTLNSSVSFPSSQIQASSHEQTIVGIPPCLFPAHTGRFPSPMNRHWRCETNFGRLVGVHRTTNPIRPNQSHGPSVAGTGT